MALSIYNTLSNKKEKFVPLEEGKVKLYLCGPTVYGHLHVGNFRGPIVFNLIRNWLEENKYDVTFVYNYTDVDDKIIKIANDEGVTATDISTRYIKYFEEDFNRLGLRKHDHNPKVTDFIPQIVDFISELVSKGKAYEVDGEVFFEINTFEDYGKLSKNNLDDLQAGQRVEVDEKKRNPLDFVLWKPAKEGEPYWDSPWGKGRPGWHIECSAMIKSILGNSIDIHGGGIDLIFPHHECEIAQSEACTGEIYCKYWVHNNFVNVGEEKMSKSLGNFVTCRQFMDQYHPEILKYIFLTAHYRSAISVTDDKIMQTVSALTRIYSAIQLASETVSTVEGEAVAEAGFVKKLEGFTSKITKALNDDFNTADFIAGIFEGVRSFNALGFSNKKKRNTTHKANSEYFLNWIASYGKMSALFTETPAVFLSTLDEMLMKLKKISRDEVEQLVARRNEARDSKDWAMADKYRDELDSLGIELFDGSSKGWRVKVND